VEVVGDLELTINMVCLEVGVQLQDIIEIQHYLPPTLPELRIQEAGRKLLVDQYKQVAEVVVHLDKV
tara:strand:- start:420 stop:620 length:201 start_codon:yes stop_codon:yes gene_type:complete